MLLIDELVLLLMSTDPLQIFAGVIGLIGALVLVVIDSCHYSRRGRSDSISACYNCGNNCLVLYW